MLGVVRQRPASRKGSPKEAPRLQSTHIIVVGHVLGLAFSGTHLEINIGMVWYSGMLGWIEEKDKA